MKKKTMLKLQAFDSTQPVKSKSIEFQDSNEIKGTELKFIFFKKIGLSLKFILNFQIKFSRYLWTLYFNL